MLENTASLKRSTTIEILICCLFFSAVIWSTNSTYSKYFFSRYYTLLFDISSRNLCIDSMFFIKKRYFFIIFVTFGLGGYPLEKGSKKVPKLGVCQWPQNWTFSCTGKHLDPFQKTWNFRTPPKQPKGSTWTPKGAKACPKGSILEVFLVPFWGPVPTVKTVFPCRREPHLRGSRVSQNSTFFMIVWSLAKRASRESLLEDFLRFGRIFEDF